MKLLPAAAELCFYLWILGILESGRRGVQASPFFSRFRRRLHPKHNHVLNALSLSNLGLLRPPATPHDGNHGHNKGDGGPARDIQNPTVLTSVPRSPPPCHSATAFVVNLRGGGVGWNPFAGGAVVKVKKKKQNKQTTLIEMLQEETGQLERQLRQYQDRQEQLTTHLSQLQEQSRLAQAQDQSKHQLRKELAKNKTTIEHLEKELSQLQGALSRMTEIKEQLEELLAQSQQTIETLQQQLDDAVHENEQLKAHYEEQLQQLRAELEAQCAEQIQALNEAHQLEMEKLEQMWQTRVEETEQEAQAMVEAEKKKMRKLVRITAQRDNKALEEFVRLDRERLERVRLEKEKGAAAAISLLREQQQQSATTVADGTKVETMRGPIK